jgi:hypothetical protein
MDYKDRKVGLVLFGILWILFGLGQGGMALLMIVGAVAGAAGSQAGALPMRMMVPIALLYLGIGAGFITLGIGSIMLRRWARALILALSWMWLITGVLSVTVLLVLMPKMLDSLPPEQAAVKPFMIGCMAVTFGLFFILVPGLAILFYRGRNVKATVEARDPVHRWTDDVPLPLLAFVVWMVGSAGGVLLCSNIYPSLPIGPWMIRGAAVPAVMVVFAGLMLFIGIGSLRRMLAAWWAAIAMFAVCVMWGVAYMKRPNFIDWYREMGMPSDPRQVEMMQTMYGSPYFVAWLVIFWGAYLAFLLYLRRYFQNANRMYPPST